MQAGVQLCYGSAEGGCLAEPADASTMRDIMDGLFDSVRRTIDAVQLPIPRQRDDDAFFAPFGRTDHPGGTGTLLGLGP